MQAHELRKRTNENLGMINLQLAINNANMFTGKKPRTLIIHVSSLMFVVSSPGEISEILTLHI